VPGIARVVVVLLSEGSNKIPSVLDAGPCGSAAPEQRWDAVKVEHFPTPALADDGMAKPSVTFNFPKTTA
jgi:hypothetical protein